MNNSLVLPSRDEMEAIKWEANVLIASGFLPRHIQRPEHAIAIMLKGRELGVPPWVALTKIQVIQGTPTVAPELMLALIYRSGELEDLQIDSQETQCAVTMKRKGMTAIVSTFTLENAQKMGLAGKDNWQKQPATMLKWRAISAAARVAFPDVIQGMYTHEEIAPDLAVNESGELTDMSPVDLPKPVNGTPRPYAPEVLQVKFEETLAHITKKQGVRAHDNLTASQIEILQGAFSDLCDPDDATRFILTLTGREKLANLEACEMGTFHKMLEDRDAARKEITDYLSWIDTQTPEPPKIRG